MHLDYDKLLKLLETAQIEQGKKLETEDREQKRVAQVIVKALSEEYIAIGRIKGALAVEAGDTMQNMEIKDGKVFVDGEETDTPPAGVVMDKPNRATRRAK